MLRISVSSLFGLCLKLGLLAIIIPVFVPFAPKMPAPGLDASWALALNQAVAQGLSFGRDIIFTLGPYSSIYTKAYHPATDFMMMAGSLYLAFSYWLALIVLTKDSAWRWLFAFAVLLLGMIYARDSLFFSYPLIVGFLCFKTEKNASQTPCLIAVLCAPFGLLALVKGSLLILTLVMTFLCCTYFIYAKENRLALIFLLVTTGSMLLFWLCAGQSLLDFPLYITNSLALASGFTQAMALDGDTKEIVLYLFASALILGCIASQKKIPLGAKLFLLSCMLVFLFLSFKTGFTRHYGHSFITGTSILIAALLLPFLLRSKLIIPAILVSIYTAQYIDGQHTQVSLLNNVVATYSSAWHGLKNRMHDADWAKHNYQFTMKFLQDRAAFPALKGTTDIYSYDQTLLISAGMTWAPRPVFQSYSVFSADMAKRNKHYLLTKNRPDNIIFKIEPIDERIPAIEDGVSWPVLLNTYRPVQFINDYLVLRKNPHPKKAPALTLIEDKQHTLGEVVSLPQSAQPIFAEFSLKPTAWGIITSLFFKPDYLFITVELNNGDTKRYRLIANMAQSGFLISPLIENTTEFGLLYGANKLLSSKKVTSFTITANQNSQAQWQNQYTLHLKRLNKDVLK